MLAREALLPLLLTELAPPRGRGDGICLEGVAVLGVHLQKEASQ